MRESQEYAEEKLRAVIENEIFNIRQKLKDQAMHSREQSDVTESSANIAARRPALFSLKVRNCEADDTLPIG